MQIKIDIPEDVYTRFFDNGTQDNEIAVDDVCEMARVIRLGTPLPKGHGKIVDVDTIDLNQDEFISQSDYYAAECAIENAPTVIEADKESEE